MGITKEYLSLLKTFHRTLAQLSRLYGVESDYEPVKNPSRASIRRLGKELDKVRTRGWIAKREKKRGGPVVEESPIEEIQEDYPPMWVDVIIDNFKKDINNMVGDTGEYQLKNDSRSARYTQKDTNRGTTKTHDYKRSNAELLVGYGDEIGGILQNAIDLAGRESVARSIIEHSVDLYELAESLVYALYDKRSLWNDMSFDSYKEGILQEFSAWLLDDYNSGE